MSESVLRGTNPTFVGTMVDGHVVGVAIADTPKPAKNKPVDGDDYTWDWWQALGEAGYFTVGPNGGLDIVGVPKATEMVQFDARPWPEKIESVIMDLVQRVETLEATIRDWSGD